MPRSNRRAPAPFDMIISGDGFMLARGSDGQPIWSQTKMPFARNVVTPAAQPYAIADPNLEAPRVFDRFYGGMGFQQERMLGLDTPGYRYGLYIDSGNGYLENGPAVTTVTPTTTGGIRRFFELNVAGTRRVCALASRYVLMRTADTAAGWAVVQDLGAGVVADRVEVFRGTAARDIAFIAVGGSTAYWTWTGATSTTVVTQEATSQAIAFALLRNELYRVDSATGGFSITKTLAGGASASWSGDFLATDLANPVTDMAIHNDRLYLATERGLYAPSQDRAGEYIVDELTPAFKYQRNADNGRGLHSWYNWLFIPMAGTLFRYDPEGSEPFAEMGLGTLEGNISEVQGICTALAGYRNWTLFACFYNAAEDASYLMRWGSWHVLEGPNGLARTFVPGWHGALYKFAGVQINAMMISEDQGGNPRLWLGDDDGKIHYIVLPRYSMAWRSDANSSFNTTNPGQVYMPAVHHGVPHENKVNLAIGLFGENLAGATRYVDVTYRTTPTASFGGAGNLTNTGRFNQDPGQRNDFTTGVSSRSAELLLTLTTTTAATPAVVRAVALYQAVRPTFKWVYSGQLRVGSGVIDGHGMPMERYFDEDDQVSALETAASTSAPVTVITPRGESIETIFTNLSITAASKRSQQPIEWVAAFQAIQHRSLATVGTWDRFHTHTWAYLANYAWEQIYNL